VRKGLAGDVGATVAVLVSLCVLWQLVSATGIVDEYLLPPPNEVARALVELRTTLFADALATGLNALLGLALATLTAVVLSAAIVFSERARRVGFVLLGAAESVPKIAFAPLLVLWLGVGSSSKVVLAASIGVFPLTVNLSRGLRAVDPDVLELTRTWRAGRWRVLRHVRIPNSLPFLIDGLRIAVPGALIGALIGEFIASERGLGHRLLEANGAFRVDAALATVAVIAVLSVIGAVAVAALERLVERSG
jgi:ABC-type nitrate/sulfonate/bicarbonate transport system permease component